MQLFYNPSLNAASKEVRFDKKESGHIIKVLRKVTGDKLHITNGKGFLFIARLADINPNKCQAQIEEHRFTPPPPQELHMVVAPTKRNERFEWFLEKATEIGLTSITPLICDHSERKTVKLERFERVLQSAMKQSLQVYLPQLNEPQSFSTYIDQVRESEQNFIAHCEETKKYRLKDQLAPHKSATILIGPEGDFSKEEIQRALEKDFKPVSLGKNRLRTETAAIVACHTFALLNS